MAPVPARQWSKSFVVETQTHIFELKQPLILPHQRVLGLGQDFHQGLLIKVPEDADHREPAYEFRNQSVMDQVLAEPAQASQCRAARRRRVLLDASRLKSHGLAAHAAFNNFFQTYKRPTANEQNVRGIHGRAFLVRMLAPALRRNIGNRAFQNLQQRLLDAFARYVARDGGIFVLL